MEDEKRRTEGGTPKRCTGRGSAEGRFAAWSEKGTEAARMVGAEAKRLSETGMEIGKKVGKRSRRWIDAIFGGDKVLWTVIIVLLIFSMLLTFSATVYKPGGTPTAKLINQLVFIGAGIAALLVVHVIKYQFYGRIANAVFIFGLILTVLAMVIGPEEAGARRDLDIPLIHIRFQPFEILKIGVIMVLAKQLARRQKNIEHTPILPSFNPKSWVDDAQRNVDIIRNETIPVLGPIVITCIFTFLSVGNSTTLIIAATCLVMLFIGRVRMADLGKMVGAVALLGIVLFAAGLGRSDTGRSRMASFKPDMLTKHARMTSDSIEIYDYPARTLPDGKVSPAEPSQSVNAKMSIASGGFFGKGPGMSTHRSNLEEAERDFAYAFIIEEYGAWADSSSCCSTCGSFPDDTDIQEVRNGLPQPAGAGARPDDSASGDDTHARIGIALSRHGPAAASDKQGRLVARLHPHGIGDDTRRQPTDFGKDARQPERRVAVRERDGRKATGRHSPQPIAIHSRPARKGTERTKQDKRHRQWRTAN